MSLEPAAEKPSDMEAQEPPEHVAYPPARVFIPIIASLYLGLFVVALDRTILATAIPVITNDFNSLGDVGWYGSAYLLTGCSTQLVVGRIYSFYDNKWVYLSSITLFEIGSLICGAAPNSAAFIVGRAIAGLGSGGVFAGGILLIIPLVPLRKRPLLQGSAGALFGIASVVGPLLGGVFTQHASWRWCFYINLPIGGCAMAVVFFVLRDIPPPRNAAMSAKQKILQLDPLGNLCFIPGMICLLLALEWGGSTYAWNNGRIIALLVVFGVLMISFIGVQAINYNDTATVAGRIIKQRTVASAFWFTFCNASAMMLFVYYLPIWFQAIKGADAVQSGIMILPLILGLVVSSIMTGIVVMRTGYYTPFLIGSSVIASIGAGLLSTLKTDTGHAKWIGFQLLFGFGLGMGMQQANIAVQCVLPKADVPVGTTLMFFAQQLGGAIFVSVSQNIFTNRLVHGVEKFGLDPRAVVKTGATELRKVVGPEALPAVLTAYNSALVTAFTAGVALACFSILGSAVVEWKNIKTARPEENDRPASVPGLPNEEAKEEPAVEDGSSVVQEDASSAVEKISKT